MNNTAKQQKGLWGILALFLVLCGISAFYLYRPQEALEGTVAVISVDGVVLRTVPLDSAEDEIFSISIETGKPVSFEMKEHAIRFVQVTCPDHVCEKAGWCRAPGQRAVCLPNRTTLICYEAGELPENEAPF